LDFLAAAVGLVLLFPVFGLLSFLILKFRTSNSKFETGLPAETRRVELAETRRVELAET
jgi:hypothetical protein